MNKDIKKTLEKILEGYKDNKKMFLSEAQFQFDLAVSLKEAKTGYDVFLEYPSAEITYKRKKDDKKKIKRIYTDILLIKENNFIPIELKYKTKKDKISVYKENDFELKTHGAQDLGRFDFLWDVQRNEILKNGSKNANIDKVELNDTLKGCTYETGFCIILTNDKAYYDVDKEHCKKDNPLYTDFCIKKLEDYNGKTLEWNLKDDTKCVIGTFRDDLSPLCLKKINLSGDWEDYGRGKNTRFKYLLLECK